VSDARTETAMPESVSELWQEFRARFHLAGQRLAAEVVAAGNDACLLIDRLRNQLTSQSPEFLGAGKTEALDALFGVIEHRLFAEPRDAFMKLRPLQRTLSAIERHRWEMNDLASRLPSSIMVSGTELVEILGPDVRGGWRKAWRSRRKHPRRLKLREIVLAHVQRQSARRARIDGLLELALAQAGLHLVAAWQACRRHRLVELSTGHPDEAALAEERRWWAKTAGALKKRIQRLVSEYQEWPEISPVLLGEAVLRCAPELSGPHQAKLDEHWQSCLSYWHRQARATLAVIELERQLSLVARDAIREVRQSLESLRSEHEGVIGELDAAIAYLQSGVEQGRSGALPQPVTNLLSADQRAHHWADRLSSQVQARIPAFVEAVKPRRPLPGWRKPWRQLHPQQALLDALNHGGIEAARDGFRDCEAEHIAVIRDIEQARQVVNFALGAGLAEGESAENLPREATANALALLQHRKEILIDAEPAAEAGVCRAQVLTFLQAHIALESGRLGLLALLTRQGAPRAIEGLGEAALGSVRAASRSLREIVGRIRRWVFWKLGLEMPVARGLEPVIERAQLSAVLETQLESRGLPALYQRLFRLAPVDDQRFLVGRETEMNGLRRAYSHWRAGGNVAVLVVGARGSGKTSLLNCAECEVFRDAPVLRGQFCERIRNSGQMAEFLRELFSLPAGDDVAAALNSSRQVAVIEEFERTFLRRMNGFDALRDFLRLIAATSGSTLWVLSMNQTSFHYLDAAQGLGRNFSHCINAMSVSQSNITEAILQRHTLSGLRLRFAATPAGNHRIALLRRFFGLERTPQQRFFDALYRQSEGIFRSAFELWLGSIDRIEGGVVRMLQPLDPNYSELEAELKPDDSFTLQVILQHGSLTAEELAEVFRIGLQEARSRLERLLALEILESEPSCPGLRVRPQAGRFVRAALARQNLL
jgi:hypothetical protein